jgi:circadian clock protein KaiC
MTLLNNQTIIPPHEKQPIPKIKTGITGLDSILQGGLPKERTTIVTGETGCGKSIFALEFLYYNALQGLPGILVNFEESRQAIIQNALTLGRDLVSLEQANQLFILESHFTPEIIIAGDFNLKGLFAIIEGQAKAMGAVHIVIDAIDVLLRFFNDPARERNELYFLNHWLLEHHLTNLITVKMSSDLNISSSYEMLKFMADCVVYFDQRVNKQISTRRMRVIKYRGSGFGRNEYPYVIDEHGMNVIPISTAELRHKGLGERISTGHPYLDNILGGGYRRSACVLIAGVTGSGKTTFTAIFIRHICAQGEKVLYIGFEESQAAILANMLSPGIDLQPALQNGQLRFISHLPEAMGIEEHLLTAIRHIKFFQPQHVIVDAISACERMGGEQIAFDYLVRLLHICKENEITCIFLNQTTRPVGIHEMTGMKISSLVDTAIMLNVIEIGGEFNRVLEIIKSRGSIHSNQHREFKITDTGIEILEAFVGNAGVLTGSARQEYEAKETVEYERRQQAIRQKQREIEQREMTMQAQIAALQAEISTRQLELEALISEDQTLQRNKAELAKMRGLDNNV